MRGLGAGEEWLKSGGQAMLPETAPTPVVCVCGCGEGVNSGRQGDEALGRSHSGRVCVGAVGRRMQRQEVVSTGTGGRRLPSRTASKWEACREEEDGNEDAIGNGSATTNPSPQ